jgi:hypothetical protein
MHELVVPPEFERHALLIWQGLRVAEPDSIALVHTDELGKLLKGKITIHQGISLLNCLAEIHMVCLRIQK